MARFGDVGIGAPASFGDKPVTFTVDKVPTGPQSARAGETMAIGIMAYGYQEKTQLRKLPDTVDVKIERVRAGSSS